MELTNNQILIELPEGVNKLDVFNTIAIANGWKEFNELPFINGKRVESKQEAEQLAEQLNAEGRFRGANPLDGDAYYVTWSDIERVKNPVSSEEFGKNLLIGTVLQVYANASLEIDTKEEQDALNARRQTIIDGVNNIKINVA